MGNVTWQRSCLAGLFEYAGALELIEEPTTLEEESSLRSSTPSEVVAFTFRQGHKRRLVIIERIDGGTSAADVWFCQQQQRSQYRLVDPAVSFPARARIVRFELPIDAKGKLLVIDPITKLSMGGVTIIGDARTLVEEKEIFGVARDAATVRSTGRSHGRVDQTQPSDRSFSSPENRAKFDRIYKFGERLTAGGGLPKIAEEQRAKYDVAFARAIMLAAVSVCPIDVLLRLDEFQEVPSLDHLLLKYWPSFMKFRAETEGLRDRELVWILNRLPRG